MKRTGHNIQVWNDRGELVANAGCYRHPKWEMKRRPTSECHVCHAIWGLIEQAYNK